MGSINAIQIHLRALTAVYLSSKYCFRGTLARFREIITSHSSVCRACAIAILAKDEAGQKSSPRNSGPFIFHSYTTVYGNW